MPCREHKVQEIEPLDLVVLTRSQLGLGHTIYRLDAVLLGQGAYRALRTTGAPRNLTMTEPLTQQLQYLLSFLVGYCFAHFLSSFRLTRPLKRTITPQPRPREHGAKNTGFFRVARGSCSLVSNGAGLRQSAPASFRFHSTLAHASASGSRRRCDSQAVNQTMKANRREAKKKAAPHSQAPTASSLLTLSTTPKALTSATSARVKMRTVLQASI